MMRCFLRPSYYETLAEAICRTIHQNIGSPLICLFYMQAIIRQRYMVFLHWIFLFCTTDFFLSFFYLYTTIWQTFKKFFVSFIISLCTTIQSKNRVLINFLFLFVHDHSTMLGVTLTLLFILFLDVPKFSLLYSWQTLPLYYDRSVFGSTAFTFRPLYSY